MAQQLTPATITAMRKVFAALEDHFDVEKGAYKGDYSDARIASETGISEAGVKQYRQEGFGKLKRPTELVQLTQDIRELEAAWIKSDTEFRDRIKDARLRMVALEKAFD